MGNILIVDGSNLLFQMFYGMPARITGKNGQPIQGTLGFMGALGKILRMIRPTHMAVIFDGECRNPRKELDALYKANREDLSLLPEEDTPFSQLPDLYRALDYAGICHRETENCEADDWIAGYAAAYGGEHRVTVCSQDSDFFQLINDRVQILRYRGENSVLCDRAYLQIKLGIDPEQYVDFKAMTGDAADNIRGAEKIGPKTAAAILGQFGSLDNALAHLEQVAKPSVRTSLEKNAQRLRLNQLLIRLDGVQSLPFTLAEMAFDAPDYSSTRILQAIGVR